jgi:hypothetical protein
MAQKYTVAQEYRDIRNAIRERLSGAKSATISSPSGQRSYTNWDLESLFERERILLKRLNMSNIRKRVYPDFGDIDGGATSGY